MPRSAGRLPPDTATKVVRAAASDDSKWRAVVALTPFVPTLTDAATSTVAFAGLWEPRSRASSPP